jgi:hypothetical protein
MQFTDFLALEDFFSKIERATLEEILDEKRLSDDSKPLAEDFVNSKSILVGCANMPSWENAWWGEHALRELDASAVR